LPPTTRGSPIPRCRNYVAATSGSTQGITDDNPPSSHPLGVASIFGQVQSKSYEESMPSNCALTTSGNYAVKHNPEAYYTAIRTDCKCERRADGFNKLRRVPERPDETTLCPRSAS